MPLKGAKENAIETALLVCVQYLGLNPGPLRMLGKGYPRAIILTHTFLVPVREGFLPCK